MNEHSVLSQIKESLSIVRGSGSGIHWRLYCISGNSCALFLLDLPTSFVHSITVLGSCSWLNP